MIVNSNQLRTFHEFSPIQYNSTMFYSNINGNGDLKLRFLGKKIYIYMKCVYGCVVCNRRYRLYAEKYWFGMVARNARRSGRYFGLLEVSSIAA